MIREAIDVRFPSEPEARSAAMLDWLEMTATPDPGPPESWEDIKTDLEQMWDTSW